jgi:hypothetical protein
MVKFPPELTIKYDPREAKIIFDPPLGTDASKFGSAGNVQSMRIQQDKVFFKIDTSQLNALKRTSLNFLLTNSERAVENFEWTLDFIQKE